MVNRYMNRIGQSVFTVFAVITLSFGLIRLMPGGPMDFLRAQLRSDLGQDVDPQRVDALVETYISIRPSDPIWVQYIDYVGSVMSGELGQSIWYSKPVATILADAAPWTVFVMVIALTLTFSIGVSLGAVMAYFEGGKFDSSTSVLAIGLTSTPYYIFALIFLAAFAYQNNWFPTGGRLSADVSPGLTPRFVLDALHHAALPIGSIVLTDFGGWALSMRGNSIRVLGEDFLRVARLRGLRTRTIAMKYVGRNAILPMYTGLMISIGFAFGGSVILETIFAYPGVGYYMLKAVNARDYPLMMGGFLIITIAVVIGILIADLTYSRIDPRAGAGDRESY